MRFARVPSGTETCAFCYMLSSRGFVYRSDRSAGRFGHFHRNCDCRVAASTDKDGLEGYDPDRERELWQRFEEIDAGEGSKAEKEAAKRAALKGHPSTAFGAVKPVSRASANVILADAQFGKKAGKHAREWGLDPSDAADRTRLEEIISDIIDEADSVDKGDWRGQPNSCTFYRKGSDLVIVNADDEFVTVMKGGGDNKRYRNAIKRDGD